MKKKPRNPTSKTLRFLRPSRPNAPTAAEGLELMRAFSKIGLKRDRKKVTELAKRLSGNGGVGG